MFELKEHIEKENTTNMQISNKMFVFQGYKPT